GFAEFTIKDVARQGKNEDDSAVNVETGNYTYICKMTVAYVVNNPGPKSTTLIVYEKPSFTNTPKNKETSESSITLECTAKGRPQPRISWTILEASGESRVTESQTPLKINPKDDPGVYNCTARSVAGSVSAVAVVQYTECDDSTCSKDSMGIEMTGLTFKSDYENIKSKESEKLKNPIEQEKASELSS
ncbi:Leucine-rich repeats and immunoglobulin-like domains protein 1, partial [Exaiptasia diaphana]